MNYIEESCTGRESACPETLRQYFDDGTIDGYERVLSEGGRITAKPSNMA